MIRIQNMIFDYDNFRALHNIDVEIEAGSVTALVGANGSGKTTLMRCLVGLELPLSGDIFVNDVNVLESPREAHQYIGYLSDSFGLDRELTVEQCLIYTAGIQKYPQEQIKRAVEETIGFLDLKEKRTTKTKYLSRGQRQRVAIGQAIIHDPLLLVMDEPASGLDPEQRENLAVIFKKLHQKGVTILVSSHILAELDEYSTHILVLQKGRVIEYRAINAASAARIFQIKILNADIYEKPLEETLNRFKAEHNILLTQFKQQDKILLETNMNDEMIAGLLKSIMEQAIPLVEFSPHKHNLKDIYQHSTKGGRAHES